MYRLIKAEWYRLKHSNGFLGWIAFFCGILLIFQVTMDDNVFSLTMEEFLPLYGESLFFGVQAFIPALVGAIVACGYYKKTAYYEVMAGNTYFSIIMSKVVVVGLFVATCVFGVSCIIPVIVGMRNGVGTVTNVVPRFLLMGVTIFHNCIASVLIVTAIRHIASTVLVYLRFAVADTFIVFLYNMLCSEPNVKFTDWFVAGQITHILNGDLNTYLIVVVFASLLLECVCWYALSCIGMKRRIYN